MSDRDEKSGCKKEKEEFVRELLAKYKLVDLPKSTEQLEERERKKGKSKRGRISKPLKNPTLVDSKALLARKIFSHLRMHSQIGVGARREMSVWLSDHLGAREVGDLLRWIVSSHPVIVASSYRSWSSAEWEKERPSCLTSEE